MSHSSFEQVHEAAAYIRAQSTNTEPPTLGIVLGSGLGQLIERLSDATSISYDTIPHMPSTTVVGHGGALIVGSLGAANSAGKKTRVACLSGRVHLYEGHEPERVVFGVRLLQALGVERLIVTNAAGGITPNCGPGTLMLITDHINLTGRNPLVGPNDARFGTRFPDMSRTYDAGLRKTAHEAASELGDSLQEGVYAGVLGPSYETPAEVRMLGTLGASAVGMSTVHEVIAARHLGLQTCGVSCITNFAAGLGQSPDSELKHEDVADVAHRTSNRFCALIERLAEKLNAPVSVRQPPSEPTRG